MPKKLVYTGLHRTSTGDAWGIANHLGTPWTNQTWPQEGLAQEYLDSVRKQAWSKGLPKHRVVPVRVTVRFTKETLAALKARNTQKRK